MQVNRTVFMVTGPSTTFRHIHICIYIYTHTRIYTCIYAPVALPRHSLPIQLAIHCLKFLSITARTSPENLLLSHTLYFLLLHQSFPWYQLTKRSNLSVLRVSCVSALALPNPSHSVVRGITSYCKGRKASTTYEPGKQDSIPRIIKWCNLNSSPSKSSFTKATTTTSQLGCL